MKNNGSLIDSTLKNLIVGQLGNEEAEPVLKMMETYMLQNNIVDAPALMGDGQTKGDWRINLTMPNGHKQDIRPDSALSYVIIKEMLKSGPIRFALEMKRSQMVSVFRNRRSVSAYCKNEELQHVTEFVIEHILPFAAFEFTWSALVYGTAFMEQVWENKTLSQLGLDGSKYYTIPKQLNLVPHETVRHINRDNQGNFDGFVQMADYRLGAYYIMSTPSTGINPGDVDVKVMDSLVIPYQGFSRNLWGESFLFPLYPLWFWYEIVIRSLVSYSELMGDPPRLGKAPSRKKVRLSPDSNDLVDAIDYLLALAVNLKRSNAVVIPSDMDEQGHPEWELGYLQTPDRSQPFVQIIELFNSMILRAALTGDRAYSQMQGQGVPSAIGQIGAEATSLHNEMVVSSWLHYLNRYWISNISKFNLGRDGVPVWLEVQGLDPKERDFLMAVSGIAGNSATFQEFFYMVDWESLGRMSGLPMLSKEEAKKLKEEISKQEQEGQVDQIRTQNKLNIENTVQQAEVEKKMGIGQFAPPPPSNGKTNLEIQLELEKLTSGQVPIFFSQNEIKKLFGEKETATPQNFFIPSPPSKDLATALAVAYKYQTIQLFNPLHDSLGRFAAKVGGGIKRGAKAVGKFAKENEAELLTAGILAGAAVAGGVAHHQFKKGLPNKAEYQANFDNQTSLAQKILATPAEYISRKGSYGALISRSALGAGGLTASFATESTGGKILGAVLPYTLAPSTFVSIAAGGAIYAKASILGSLATAAFATAVFGATAPAAATLIGGVLVGSAATIIAYQLVDHAGKKFTNGYIKRYAPKDPYHITVTQDDETKRRTFTKFSMDNLGILSLYFFGNLATTLLEEEEDGNLMASVMPMVAMLVFDDRVKRISAPFEIPGFTHGGNEWFLTKDLAPNFIKLWAGGNTELENIQLFNPAHDNLGRFASKSGGGFALLGGNLDPKRTPKPLQAQRSANKVMSAVGQKFKSGLVKGAKVEACGDWDCMKAKTGISANALGAYHKGKVVLSPHGLAYSAYDNPKFFNRIVAHEATHARRRSGGGGIEFFSRNQVDLEEGATELISMGHTKYPYAKSPYIKQMRSVAAAARRGSGGNQSRAWQLVSLMHYHNDTDRGLAAYRAYANSDKFNKGSDADVEWLMGSMPTQLELEDDFEKDFKTSENEIYKVARKVQQKTFPPAKVFEESELI